MSFPAAFQSAVFYIVACTPCAKVRHRQKARATAKKERKEKERVQAEQPDQYQHPSPFNTNPYWDTEIAMGPTWQKSGSKNSSQRGLTSSGRDSTAPSVSERTNVADSRTNFGDSMVAIDEEPDFPHDWNRRQGYQREDEELWGQWSGQKLMDAFSKARDSAGRLIDATLGIDKEVTEEERREFYFAPKNPPINDYHPPVVSSKAPNKAAHRWMLQPPPSAKVMEGKVPVSRAASSGSKSSARTLVGEEVNLGRLVQEKLVMEKLKKENSNPTESELIESLFLTRSNRSMSFTRGRSFSLDGSDDSVDYTFPRRPRTRPRAVAAPPGCTSTDDDSDDEPIPFPQNVANPNRPRSPNHAAIRPKLETIQSSRSFGSGRLSTKRKSRRSNKMRRALSGATSPVGDDTD